MGRKGGTTHLKRNPAPKFWTIHRKEFVWTVRPKSGPHALQQSLPLTLIVKEMLGYANHLGLYAEETGHRGEALGNFPQAFTHLALISAAFNLDRALGARD